VTHGDVRCLVCGQITKAADTRRLAREGQMRERMVAVVLHHPDESGKRYRLATSADKRLLAEAATTLEEKTADWTYLESPLPDEEIPSYELRRISLPLYGLTRWRDLFNARQQLTLITFLTKTKGCYDRVQADYEELFQPQISQISFSSEELAKAVLGYLGLLLSKMADYNSNIVSWINTLEAVRNSFARQALAMVWDFFEVNIFSGSAGDYTGALDWTLRYLHSNPATNGNFGLVQNASASNLPVLDNHLDAILTDPPYYDNVPYAALSDFFYVWLKRAIGDYFPELFATPVVTKIGEIVHDRPHKLSDSHKTKEFFEEKLCQSFKEMHRILKPEGIAVIVYAHKTTEGWETMLNGLAQAELVVTGSWPVHTERGERLVAAQTAALASSIYMVCRKMEREPVGFWNELQPKIQERVEHKLAQFWAEGIAGGDFFISAIGPGMEEFSRYERVETYSGEPVGVAQLLTFIRQVATDFLVNRLLVGASREAIDKEAQFYLTYRWTYLENKVPFDDARKIASAEGVDLEQLWGKGGFVKKSGADIEVLGPQKRGGIKEVRNMVEAMHQACQLWEKGRKEELTRALAHTGFGQSGAFWQFCQAVAECLLEGSKEKQLLEGLLIGKDTYIRGSADVVEQAKPRVEQKRLFD
jgi:putative DNA methylase